MAATTNIKSIDLFVPGQMPAFITDDPRFARFVEFITVYHKWLSEPKNVGCLIQQFRQMTDIDTTLPEFLSSFRNMFMTGWPENLAVDPETLNTVRLESLLKNMKDFYLAKGSEPSFQLLFRAIFNSDVSLEFPKEQILRASSADWIVEKILRVTNTTGSDFFDGLTRQIRQRDETTGEVIAAARIARILQFRQGPYAVSELLLSSIFGKFQSGGRIEVDIDDDGNTISETILPIVLDVSVISGGTGYTEGENIPVISNAGDETGVGAKVIIERVGLSGEINCLRVEDPGTNYIIDPTFDLSGLSGTGASLSVTRSGLFCAPGVFASNDSKLDSNRFIQGDNLFHAFSYIILSEINFIDWKDIVKRLVHPAGFAFFGRILIQQCLETFLKLHTELQQFELPLIGHYTAYTLETTDDLFALYPTGFDPVVGPVAEDGSSGVHAPINALNAIPDSGSKFDQPWVVYHHPNTRTWFRIPGIGQIHPNINIRDIARDLTGSNPFTVGEIITDSNATPVRAKVLQNDTTIANGTVRVEMLTNDEFSIGDVLTGETSGETANVIIPGVVNITYSNGMPFRDIVLRDFFRMPLGIDWDCRTGDGQDFGDPNNLL